MMCSDVDRDLDAYVDRELEPARMTAVREHVEQCDRCRARLAARLTLTSLVRATSDRPAPAALRARVEALASPRRGVRPWLAAAAGLVLAVGATGMLWQRHAAASADTKIAEAAVVGHVQAIAGNRLVEVRSTDQHTVKPWFLGKIDFSPPVADLASLGYPLTGGRLDRLDGHAVAVLVYQRRAHPIDVYIWPSSAGPAIDATRTIRGFHLRHWIRGGMTFWVVSDLGDAELDAFAAALERS